MSHSKALMPVSYSLPSTTGSIESYVQAVNAFPILSQEEENELAMRFQKEGDLRAAETLVLSNLRYVARIAHGYKGYGLAFADLVQEGSIGLMKAVKRFDPSMGVRLVSFAVHWIKSEIHEFVIRNWRIVKVATTKAQRKLFFNLRRNKKRQGWFTAEEVNAVAQDLGVSAKTVVEMESRLCKEYDIAFDRTDEDSEESTLLAPVDYLAAPDLNPLDSLESNHAFDNAHENLTQALETLDTRSQDIVKQRWLLDEKMTLKALADKYQVSIERIRQIQDAAMLKLKDYFIA
jgi:RNA polymerase sigma-32 factor